MHQKGDIEIAESEYERVLDKLVALKAENALLKAQVEAMMKEPNDMFYWLINLQRKMFIAVKLILTAYCDYKKKPTKAQHSAFMNTLLDMYKELKDDTTTGQ